MFWKGKGAFILGCTSPFKAIMIDRPGMGKVKNLWKSSGPSSILNSPRFHAYCYLPSFCLSRASPGLHFFPSLLFSGSFVQCALLFHKFLTFPIPGRSIIIALNGDVQPRIKAPFPFQNILSRLWSVKISLTDGTSCWIHLVKPWICRLSSILRCRNNATHPFYRPPQSVRFSHSFCPVFKTPSCYNWG
jgi:hypothetical protein